MSCCRRFPKELGLPVVSWNYQIHEFDWLKSISKAVLILPSTIIVDRHLEGMWTIPGVGHDLGQDVENGLLYGLPVVGVFENINTTLARFERIRWHKILSLK